VLLNYIPVVDNCEENPCENKGTCENKINTRICHCVDGYDGINCEIGKFHLPVIDNTLNSEIYCSERFFNTW
jgi:hypothetical protein